MTIKLIVLVLIAFGGGITVGGATAAFLTILQIIPRIVQVSDTRDRIKLYRGIMIAAFIIAVIVYFSEFSLGLHEYITIPIGLILGIFIGLLSSALAEVLNVIPILSKKLKIKDSLKYIIWALMGGKVTGALIFWLYLNQGR